MGGTAGRKKPSVTHVLPRAGTGSCRSVAGARKRRELPMWRNPLLKKRSNKDECGNAVTGPPPGGKMKRLPSGTPWTFHRGREKKRAQWATKENVEGWVPGEPKAEANVEGGKVQPEKAARGNRGDGGGRRG